ncbi:MAG: hypothetical protein K2K58_09325, partial [Muribaculaceae bacterium]|nr:hypothetical protein [Muribaculaceae bacterium]
AQETATPESTAHSESTSNSESSASPEVVQTPEEAIVMNSEGVRVAHVTADNFSDAFAQARAQVGPGGVFEYNGQLYGTYLEDEWNEMSTQDRADYYHRVSETHPTYASHSNHSSSHTSHAHTTHTAAVADNNVAPDAEILTVETVDDSIHVLGVQSVQNDQGDIMNVALVESQGDMAMLIDIDNDGTIEVALHDDNYNGQIEDNEVYDVSGANIQVEELYNASMQQNEAYNTGMDEMPDYTNDADLAMEV